MKKIQHLLTRSNKEITADRAKRITTSVENSFKKKVINLQNEISQMEDKRERLLDMSASNTTTTRNAINDLEADGFVDEIVNLDTSIELKKRHLKIAKDTQKELLGEYKEDTKKSS